MNLEEAKALLATRSYWHHTFEIFPGLKTSGNYEPSFMWEMLSLPADLKGARVLDIGPSDGFFSMKLAQAGADVFAVDYKNKDAHGFGLMETITGLTFSYYEANFYDIPKLNLGKFDIVLCLGVLYHLPDLFKAVIILKDLCLSRILLETEYEPDLTPGIASARYYAADSLNQDPTNFWVPNAECLEAIIFDVGLATDRTLHWGRRTLVDASVRISKPTLKTKFGYQLFDEDWQADQESDPRS